MNASKSGGIAITPGDPAGIGPAVLVQAVGELAYPSNISLHGDPRIWLRAARFTGESETSIGDLISSNSTSSSDTELPEPGAPTAMGAKLAWLALDSAISSVKADQASAIVTGPVSKFWMDKAGFPYPGHTEYLESEFEAQDVLMAMYAPEFVVGLVTAHVPLHAVPTMVTKKAVVNSCGQLLKLLNAAGKNSPRIAICGLNPHAGENGLLGSEEDCIDDAVAELRQADANISGPLPGDTVFHAMAGGKFDAVLAMYHDQGLGPFKLRHFDDGVNVTCGLPVIRTSPDHGTAFEIAPKDIASSASAKAAIELAQNLQRRW